MKIKTVTWNIGGAKLLSESADPTLMGSYGVEGLEEIILWLQNESPDIIMLQETEKNDTDDQVATIASRLGYEHYFHDSTSESHIDKDYSLGHAIISRYPLSEHQTGFFTNPNLKVSWEDGSIASSFDKGYTTCHTRIGDAEISLTTLHLIPFRAFKIDLESELATTILKNVEESLSASTEKWIIQGDFNIDSGKLSNYLPRLFDQGLDEIDVIEATTPNGRKYDHLLFRQLKLLGSRIDSNVRTDHFPIISELEF